MQEAESEDEEEQPVTESEDEDEEEEPVTESEDEDEQSEPEVNSNPLAAIADPLGPVVVEETLEIKDSELPVSESSDEGPTLSMAMDPATVARLRSELEEERQSRNPGPGDDGGEGAF